MTNINSASATFALNTDEQASDGCKATNDDCVVVAELDTVSFICEDSSCVYPRANYNYQVGDEIIILIKFKDPSFTKFISKLSAYIKGDKFVYSFTNELKTIA